MHERVSGFEKALTNYTGMTIVQRIPGEGQRDKAFKAAQDLLQAHPDIDAIFGINDDSALGAVFFSGEPEPFERGMLYTVGYGA